MAAPDPAQTWLPSSRTIAFAVAVVKSRPPELSIGEYIRLLRLHFAKGKRSDAISTEYHHLDRSSFWKSEFWRMQDKTRDLEDENTDLRMEVERLRAEAGTKRKRRVSNRIEADRAERKKRRIVVLPVKVVEMPFEHAVEQDLAANGDLSKMLLRCVFRIQTAVKENQEDDPEELAYRLEQAASTICKLVQQEITTCLHSSEIDRFQATLSAVTRAMVSIFLGFKHLCSGKNVSRFQGRIVYAVVSMFKELLCSIELLSAKEVKSIAGNSSGVIASTQVTKAGEKATRSANLKESPMLSALTSFLGNLIQLLDANAECNRHIFEGLAYCVMERLGSRLFSSTFGHSRAPTIEAEIAKGDTQDDTKQRQIQIEAPYLTHLLHRIMMAAPAHLGSAKNKRTGKPKFVKKNDPKNALAVAAKECLQRTLVNSIFGTEGVDETDPFMDCLKMPNAGAGPITIPKGKDVDLQEWYKEEVWKLLGWEILEREEGFAATM